MITLREFYKAHRAPRQTHETYHHGSAGENVVE